MIRPPLNQPNGKREKCGLTNLKPQLGAAPPRLGYIKGESKGHDKARNAFAPWRAWYRTARWQRLRLEVFLRDAYQCQRTGVICAGKHPAPDSPVANHRRPHKGDPVLFWDQNNVETVTKEVHDALIQSEERAAEIRPRGG